MFAFNILGSVVVIISIIVVVDSAVLRCAKRGC